MLIKKLALEPLIERKIIASVLFQVRNISGAGPPRLGNMTVRVLLSGDLRNYPRASSPISTTSPTLTGCHRIVLEKNIPSRDASPPDSNLDLIAQGRFWKKET
jgi:hypothetical protein